MVDEPVVDPVEQQRKMWTIGDYPRIARHLLPISVDAVASLQIEPGQKVLDIAVGNGNAAVEAARRGATVVGIDLTPAQIERARQRCAAEGVEVDLRVGDAQALDVETGSFDATVSVMGMIFAPDHAAATAEMARAVRPGGHLALTAWMTGGWSTAWRTKLGQLAPAPPPGMSPDEWGDPDEAIRRLARAGLEARVEQRDFTWVFESYDDAFDTFTNAAGPFVAFMSAMTASGAGDEARARLMEVMAEANEAADGTCRLAAPYLLVTAVR